MRPRLAKLMPMRFGHVWLSHAEKRPNPSAIKGANYHRESHSAVRGIPPGLSWTGGARCRPPRFQYCCVHGSIRSSVKIMLVQKEKDAGG